MAGLTLIGFASTNKKNLTLSLISSCIFLWVCLPFCIPAQDADETLESIMELRGEVPTFEQRPEPFIRQGMPGEEPIEIVADEVLNAIAAGRDIEIEYAIIDGDLDTGMIAEHLEFDENGNPIIWGNIVIRSSEIRGYTMFCSNTFRGDSTFSSVTFSGDADFLGAVFTRYAAFSAATFGGYADFTGAVFGGNAHFIGATFKGNADFKYAAFSAETFFTAAVFNKNVDFSNASMSSATDFLDVTFTVSAYFLRTAMELPANFEGVHYRENTVISGLWNNVFCQIISFVTWHKLNLPKRLVTDFSRFDTGNIMDGSSNPYLKRYIDDEQWIESWRESVWWRQPLFVLWEITSHCGRSIGLWGAWSGVIAFTFAVIYSRVLSDSIDFSVDKLSHLKPGFKSYLYYSVVTLTTLGYGDIVPLTNRARFAVGVEVGLGYVMLGGLISIFANKLARRS